jgi:NAD-dependent dihydropyrimidine dehydrogenase PreA subunit
VPYVVTSACIDTKEQSCVEVCPVDCIYEAERMLVIHPDECIDCSACVTECPVEAIVLDCDVADGQSRFIAVNAEVRNGIPAVDAALAALGLAGA